MLFLRLTNKEFYGAVGECLRHGGVFGAFGYYIPGDIVDRPVLSKLLGEYLIKNLNVLTPAEVLLKNHYWDLNLPFEDIERREACVKYPTSNEKMVGILQSHVKDLKGGHETVTRFKKSLPCLKDAYMYIDVFGVMGRANN